MTTWQRNWCSWELSCDGDGKSFPSCWESFTYASTSTVQVKSVSGISSPFQVSSCSLQVRAGNLFYTGLFWSWTRTFGHALSGIKNLREIRAKAAFSWLKRVFFPDLFVSSQRIIATKIKKRTLCIVSGASKPKEVNHLRTTSFWTYGRHFITMATVTL